MNKIILNIGFRHFHFYHGLCDYVYINNLLYIVFRSGDNIHICIIKDFILIEKYVHSGIHALINNNILYIFDKTQILYKYNIIDFKYIETIKLNNINNININIDNINNINLKDIDLDDIDKIKSKLIYCDNLYIIIYHLKNNVCRIFDFYDNKNYYISTDVNFEGLDISYNNNNIYFSYNNKTMIFNIKTKLITNEIINYIIPNGKCKNLGEIYKLNNTKFIIYNGDNIYQSNKIYKIDTKEIIEYIDRDYMYMENYNIKDNIYIDYEGIYILTKSTISIFSENNNDKMVKLGESFIPLNILIKRSKLIKSMFLDLKDNFELNEIKNDLFEHIDCYIDYIKTNDIKNVLNLFKILNYLEDIDVEHIASYISKKAHELVKCNNILMYGIPIYDILIYDILELLYTSPFTPQFIYLLNEILYRKNYNDIINNLKDKSCYNYILKYNLIIHNTNYIRIK